MSDLTIDLWTKLCQLFCGHLILMVGYHRRWGPVCLFNERVFEIFISTHGTVNPAIVLTTHSQAPSSNLSPPLAHPAASLPGIGQLMTTCKASMNLNFCVESSGKKLQATHRLSNCEVHSIDRLTILVICRWKDVFLELEMFRQMQFKPQTRSFTIPSTHCNNVIEMVQSAMFWVKPWVNP